MAINRLSMSELKSLDMTKVGNVLNTLIDKINELEKKNNESIVSNRI